MSEFQGYGGPLPYIPDDLTVPQFFLDYRHTIQPSGTTPLLIEDATGRKVRMDELRARTQGFANALHTRWNIGSDDVVCIFTPNDVDYPVMIWGIHRLGAIVTPANPAYTPEELTHQLHTTAAKLVICHPSTYVVALEAARAVGIAPSHIMVLGVLPRDAKASYATISELIESGMHAPKTYVECKLKAAEGRTKLAFLSFSSGTTGLPKAVMVPHYALIANVVQAGTYMLSDKRPYEQRFCRPDDVVLSVLPFYHAYGLVYMMHFGLWFGWKLVVIPKFNFVEMLKSIERYRINHLPLVPPMAVLFCKHPEVKKHDLRSMRSVMCGAAPLSGELMQQLSEKFPDMMIGQGFGMTETFCLAALPQLDQKLGTLGSAGRLIAGITAKVLRPDGTPAAPGEAGQLVLTGPAAALGYLNNETASKETFLDGWVYSGDEVIINEQTELFVVDRIKELLKVRGLQVAPAELEGFLLDHPDVSDACVVSILDDYHGDLPMAFVVPSADAQTRIKRDASEADRIKAGLVKYVADGKAYYKQLSAGVAFIDAIPRNPSGKLLRRHLRDHAREMWKKGQLSSSQTKAKL